MSNEEKKPPVWRKWEPGRPAEINSDEHVWVKLRSGFLSGGLTRLFRWDHKGGPHDIIAWAPFVSEELKPIDAPEQAPVWVDIPANATDGGLRHAALKAGWQPAQMPECRPGVVTLKPSQAEASNPNPLYHLTVPGYDSLASVLRRAYAQAASGKGAERHAQGHPFDQQPMQQLIALYGPGFALGQAAKKAQESQRLPRDRAVAELLGAINYLAGAVIALERQPETN